MEFMDARRLPGPNLLGDLPGSILDIACATEARDEIVATWKAAINAAHIDLGWPMPTTHWLSRVGGISLFFTAPIDHLYAATALNEWAFKCITALAAGNTAPPLDIHEVNQILADEQNPSLLHLQQAALDAGVTLLWDDDSVSLGEGCHSRTWPAKNLPAPGELSLQGFQSIPTCIVTGTNGKTTTARIVRYMLQHAGRHVGMSCTDWIAVDGRILDLGDWSGPGGARTVLRETAVDCAVLETARGGLLRRGLGVTRADAAIITNIAEDHLGDFGSRTIDELLEIKWIVSRATRKAGVLVLNANDKRLVAKAHEHKGKLHWFGMDEAAIVDTRKKGETAFFFAGNELVCRDDDGQKSFCRVDEVPLTLGGAARHNVANALAAAAATYAMGLTLAEIANGLRHMTQTENPGRTNLYEVDGIRVLVDFAHNPHAMNALFELACALPANRRLLTFGQPGDRPDESIRETARAAYRMQPDLIQITELAHYHRGRAHGEVFALLEKELLGLGMPATNIAHFEDEVAALNAAIQQANPGDLVIMLALDERAEIAARLKDNALLAQI